MMLDAFLPGQLFAFLLVFSRIGTIFMIIPGIGEAYVPPRVRLAMALLTALAILPFVQSGLPAMPDQVLKIFALIFGEVLVGMLIGFAAKLTLSALHVAGMVIAFQSSLSSAQFFDPAQQTQGALVGSFMTLLGLTVIFTADLHLLMVQATFDSYSLFPAAALPPIEGFAEIAVMFVAKSFLIGMQISAPFIAYALILYFGMGLLNRLMPSLQVFFLVMPLNIALSMLLLLAILGGIFAWFTNYFEDAIGVFLAT